MRVLFLAHRLPYPPDKGDKIRSFWELKTLAQSHEVDLCCFYDYEEDAKHIAALRPYCRHIHAERLSYTESRARALVALLTGEPFSLGYFFTNTMKTAVNELLASGQYGAIVIFSSSMAQYVEHAVNTRRIVDLVDVDSEKWEQYAAESGFPLRTVWAAEGKRLRAYESRLAAEFDEVLLCTNVEAEIFRQRSGSEKVRALMHMVDLSFYDPAKVEIPASIRELGQYVIFTGSMDYRPNDDAALHFAKDVLPLLRKKVPKMKFVVGGRNPSKELLGLHDDVSIIVTGSVPDIRPWIQGAMASVAPMRIARGVQNKILEAMALGVPVVASAKTAAALPNEVGALVETHDEPEAIAGVISRWASSQPDPATLRERVLYWCNQDRLAAQLNAVVAGETAVQERSGVAR